MKAPPPSTRQELIRVASRLFYEQGFVATGIQQILTEVGIAKGTFYSHFKSKEELGVCWLQGRHAVWSEWFEAALQPKRTPATQLLASYDFLEQWLRESRFRGCAFINIMAETPDANSLMRAEVKSHKLGVHQRFQELAIAHQAANGGRAARGKSLGTTLYLLFEGALVESQNFCDLWPIHAAREQAKRFL